MATIEAKPAGVNLHSLIERRYEPGQGYLTFFEVANGTGFKGTGYCDALVMSTWPSKGIQLLGFEVKRSRSDLIKELRDENKAETFQRYCDRWWLVVSDSKLTDGVEVPANWGILAPRNGVLHQVRAAPKLQREDWKPEFIAALMRRFHEAHIKKDADELKKLVELRAQELYGARLAKEEEHRGRAGREEALKSQYDVLKRSIADFEVKSGINVNAWDAGNIGIAVSAILESIHNGKIMTNALKNIQQSAERVAISVKNAIINVEGMAVKGKLKSAPK